MSVQELNAAVNTLAPFEHAAEWDNVGLLVGRMDAPCEHVLLTIDLTGDVLAEAIERKVQAVVAYHPVIFKPVPQVTSLDASGRVLLGLIEAGIAVVSPHTALDAAPNGMTCWLAEGIGAGTRRAVHPADEVRPSEAFELVINVPRDAMDAVREAAASAGAGQIGAYDTCSTAAEIIGTFRGGEGTNPTIGTAGNVEHVEEYRLTLVCGVLELPEAIAAVKAAHPYEEPPIHVVPLSPHTLADHGEGRVLQLDEPASIETIADRLKTHLDVPALRMVKAGDDPHTVAACCPGAGGSMLHAAAAAGATLFVTGEMRHHDLLEARSLGISVLLAGHTHTERGFLPHLAARLAGLCPAMTFTVSTADVAPWQRV